MRVPINCAALITSLGLMGGCSGSQPDTGSEQSSPVVSGALARKNNQVARCPGQEFSSFLKGFASDEKVRERFTLPTVTVVDYEDPAGGGGDSDATRVFHVPRSKYRQFTLRYSNGAFHHADSNGKVDTDPLDVKISRQGRDYLVGYSYGMSEGNSWLFRYRVQCWYLAEDPEAPAE